MEKQQIRKIIRQELPVILNQDKEFRDWVRDLMQSRYAEKVETESRFDRMLEELRRDREENSARIDRILDNIEAMSQKHESSIGALGARWGLRTEQSFRSGLKGILESSFGVQVINVVEFDDEGEVFGRPDQVEIDVIILNGVLILCELNSSISKPEMYTFDRKVRFYEKHHKRKADRKLVISPMVDPKADGVAKKLGIEVYSYADEVPVKKVNRTAKKKKS